MKIGYSNNDYPNKRNIIGLVPNAHYVRIHDINTCICRFARRMLRRNPIDIANVFNDRGLNRVDLMHFFNTISLAPTPWISTFETIVPRFKNTLSCHHGRNCDFTPLTHDTRIRKALNALASNACRRLIALSQCNRRMQLDLLHLFPDHYPLIEPKITCLHPPQPPLVDEYAQKQLPLNGPVRFLFVGHNFFGKGGAEVLESFQHARKSGQNLSLTIVSCLCPDDYATKTSKKDVEKAKNLIRDNSDWIQYWPSLDNQQVLQLMKNAHVGLLPTYADTYGYSVLEFQAAGCPVISTNIRALPEINNNETGWVIQIPKNRLGEALYTTGQDRAEISAAIKKGLTHAIEEIMNDRQTICRKANASIRHIKQDHSPQIHSTKLSQIYQRALNMTNK